MSRNQNSHFSLAPHANIRRSRLDKSHGVTLSCNAADIVPFMVEEILPGSTYTIDTSIIARMQTLTVPIYGNIYLDSYYFYCPSRLLWKHFVNFCGESDEPWFDDTEYTIPQLKFVPFIDAESSAAQKATPQPKTLYDYLGLPLPNDTGIYSGVDQLEEVNHLPFRMYCKVFNDWFRNENIQDLTTFNTEDANVTIDNVDHNEAWYGGKLLKANKYKDYFTSVLPEPQKGPEVTIGVGDTAPVFSTSMSHNEVHYPLTWVTTDGEGVAATGNNKDFYIVGHLGNQSGAANPIPTNFMEEESGTGITGRKAITPSNLWADISNATGISINELRLAFATQRFYEQAARGGSRYIEILESMFGVTNGDLRLQRSEYLGGNRVQININSVYQQSETNTTPLGNVGAYSLTSDTQNSFTKSFTEHGYLMGLLVIRYDHSYSQGIPRMFSRKDKFDFFWPAMANLGEMPVLNKEIYMTGDKTKDNEVFGYQEAWADYRYANNIVLGEMRPTYAQSLDFWHLGDDYDELPSYSEEWIVENEQTIDRTLAVSSNVADQFLVDMWINNIATLPMPLFSVPGLDVM